MPAPVFLEVSLLLPLGNRLERNADFTMLTGHIRKLAGASVFFILTLALWGCTGSTKISSMNPTAPAFTTQPASQTVTVGQTAMFSVTATGTSPLTYQWQKNNANISGATSASYTTPATVSGDNGATFRVVVTNSAGSATSNSATLTVTTSPVGPSINTQPANQTVTVGQTATFSVTAGGTAPLSLPVAEEQRQHFRRDLGKLHNSRNSFRRQRRDVPRDRHQLREQRYEQFGDSYRQPGGCLRRNRCHDLSQRHRPHRPKHHGNEIDAGQREFDDIRPAPQPRRGRPGGRGAAVSFSTLRGGQRAQRCVHRDRA